MVLFDSSGHLIDQISGHHGLLEIYAHIYASLFLFLVSLSSIGLLYYFFRSSIFRFQGLLNGLFYTGLIGLGETLEHVFLSPKMGSFFHYLHLFAAPIAIIFYFFSLQEIFSKKSEKIRKVDSKKSISVFSIFLTILLLLSSFSNATWDVEIEVPLVLVTVLPTLVLVGMLLEKSKIISDSALALISLRVMLLGVSALTISILAGRYGDFAGKAQVYIIFHQLQNISHVVTGTALLIFVATISQMEKIVVSATSK
jgi:hypothetical protein